ncbi:MAG TPA: nuclear transport factor 2 family protein [Actinophytocola sp.]|uniref:nuclear transport factor 2 family protein n=1 Tax=Actinophytocola sp. TaxID=1872138 RepID=UPI002DBD37BA|nr:nuclear transport factor 2 family protein [Actinophytocola sp.]HEU5471814.1 nuclear transport factor 2 family protein [Actinophytocola sp.]
MAEAKEFVEHWTRIWAEHDGAGWPELLHEGCELRNPLGTVPRSALPGYMANLLRAMPDHTLTPTGWGETADGVLIEWVMTGGGVEIRGADRFTLRDGRATEGFAYFDPAPMIAAMTPPPLPVERLAREYDAAWNAGDVEAIVARHAPNGSYRLHIGGGPEITGRAAMHGAFTAALGNWRELSFELNRIRCGADYYVWESTVRGELARPLRLGPVTIEPTGRTLTFTGIDLVSLDADGLISAKDTWFDILAAVAQSTSVSPPVPTS